MKAILSDQQDVEAPICAPYRSLFGLNVGTICTVAMDLQRRELHLRMGASPGEDFQVFALNHAD
jgi:hypothetical protein